MPHVSKMTSGRYLKKDEVEPSLVVTVKGCQKEDVSMENQAPDHKWVLTFHEEDKGLVLNNTNLALVAFVTGQDNSDDWLGQKIELYNDPTIMFGGKRTGGIRVRAVGAVAQPVAQSQEEAVNQQAEDFVEFPEDEIPY